MHGETVIKDPKYNLFYRSLFTMFATRSRSMYVLPYKFKDRISRNFDRQNISVYKICVWVHIVSPNKSTSYFIQQTLSQKYPSNPVKVAVADVNFSVARNRHTALVSYSLQSNPWRNEAVCPFYTEDLYMTFLVRSFYSLYVSSYSHFLPAPSLIFLLILYLPSLLIFFLPFHTFFFFCASIARFRQSEISLWIKREPETLFDTCQGFFNWRIKPS
jgi:hypothetical protein